MWRCIETVVVSCVCGADSGSDGPERTADVETDDVDPVEVVSQSAAGSDMMPAQESSITREYFKFVKFLATHFHYPVSFSHRFDAL